MSHANPHARHTMLGLVALSLFAALFTRLWYLQVLTTDEYEVAARSNRFRTVIEQAPRGRILDRNRNVLVENRRTIQVTIAYQDFIELDGPEASAMLRRLARELTADQLRRYDGQLVDNDPGPLPEPLPAPDPETEDPATTEEAPDSEEPEQPEDLDGDAGAVEGSVPDDDEMVIGEDQMAPTQVPVRPPPAGVATGADNPDGQGAAPQEAPEPVTEEMLRERLEDPRFSKFKPIPVAIGVSEQLEVYLRENAEDFPTVAVERVTRRDYRYGALLAHVLGYVGAINADELETFQNDEKPYENDDEIGKTGIERALEAELRGVPGQTVYEVDARNRPVRQVSRREPQAGNDVYLTIDINLQFLAEKGLAAEIERRKGARSGGCELGLCDPVAGAVTAVDPRNGQVLAMASYPTYDPNLFVGGISTRDYEAISAESRKDIHHNPLTNRAIAGQYLPGSTFKLFSAHAGLATQQITPGQVYNDTGVYLFRADCDISLEESNCFKQNAGRTQHGAVNLASALTVSSDTYFYKLGNEAWLRRETLGETVLQDQMRLWGLGSPTGVDLTGEAPGRIPTPEWLREFSNAINQDNPELAEEAGRWNGGISANTVIGQGDVLATPIQLASGYGTFANGGTVYRPQLVFQVSPASSDTALVGFTPDPTGEVPFQPDWHSAMAEGFRGVTISGPLGRGTAATPFDGFDQSTCEVAGKTGTSQKANENDTSLFTAYAPAQAPAIAVAAVVEEGGFGGEAAAPIVRRMLEPMSGLGCTSEALAALNDPNSPYRAPLGGWFDVQAAMTEFVPPIAPPSAVGD